MRTIERNRLLLKLTEPDLRAFAPFMQEVYLTKGQILLEPDTLIHYVYFPVDCICSILAATKSELVIEVGMFGFEGMSNLVVTPGDRTFFRTIVIAQGTALRVNAEDFTRAIHKLPSLSEVALRHRESAAVQFGYSAHAHGSFTIEARLARWILMAIDRWSGAELPITHDLMASLLCVRRSGITTAIAVLEGTGAIKATRGLVTVRNREKLQELAGGCYGPSERAYDLILGQRHQR